MGGLADGMPSTEMPSTETDARAPLDPVARAERGTVSVVIAAYDEARYIEGCLRSLADQTVPPHEVIVVDDGSRDATARRVARHPSVRLIRQPHRGAAVARNRGARVATGDILVFLDGDMELTPQFVERLVAPMVERGALGTFTREIKLANPERVWARAHVLGRGLSLDARYRPDVPDRWDVFRAVWRSDFERVGGFDEVGHGEDVTLARKLGAMAEVAPGAVCYHYDPDTLGDVYRSARWFGRGERIKEQPAPLSRYAPWTSLARALRMAVRHRAPSVFVYRLVWDFGLTMGWLTRHRASTAK